MGIKIKVGFIKIEFTVFEIRKEFNFVLLGPLTLRPKPFDHLATISSGNLALKTTGLICESKGGTVGAEEVQCWEASNEVNPVIMTFKDVKKLDGGGLNLRRLSERDTNYNTQEKGRKLQTTSAFQFNCVLSETDLSGTQDILINYERCQISSGSFEIGLTQAIGVGVTTYSSSLNTGTVILPSPIQDTLTTVVRDCNAEWLVLLLHLADV